MANFYIVGCFLIALVLPHLTDDSVRVGYQIVLQLAFVLIGATGYKTFED